jgi:hypothetical protein
MALNPSLQGEKLVTKNLSYDKTKIAIWELLYNLSGLLEWFACRSNFWLTEDSIAHDASFNINPLKTNRICFI